MVRRGPKRNLYAWAWDACGLGTNWTHRGQPGGRLGAMGRKQCEGSTAKEAMGIRSTPRIQSIPPSLHIEEDGEDGHEGPHSHEPAGLREVDPTVPSNTRRRLSNCLSSRTRQSRKAVHTKVQFRCTGGHGGARVKKRPSQQVDYCTTPLNPHFSAFSRKFISSSAVSLTNQRSR